MNAAERHRRQRERDDASERTIAAAEEGRVLPPDTVRHYFAGDGNGGPYCARCHRKASGRIHLPPLDDDLDRSEGA